uniref:Uncharacterized protein n=1 Tax=Rhizophora mucronata TaxID=61149 RepID=A0A2P2Q007_RHIMU
MYSTSSSWNFLFLSLYYIHGLVCRTRQMGIFGDVYNRDMHYCRGICD